jgi:maltose alpha-D-glucosyltransferase/alpha-amylase
MQPEDLWYKRAIIYCLDVETYMDGNGDGIGDFVGLRGRLDEIASLGITCIWLLPFYPTPNRDNGYDIKDYYGVDSRLGTLGDFVEFVHLAGEYGIRVIVDLVVNHTSSEHPWFQEARRDRNSPYYDYYVWADEKPDTDAKIIFPGQQENVWTYNEETDSWYLHRFYEHQPDLNIANPQVRAEIRKIMGFWLQLGIAGFRMDAAPYIIEQRGIDRPGKEDPYEYLTEFREFLSWRQGDACLLAEVNVPPDQIEDYFGDGNRMHMLFNFSLCAHSFLALSRHKAKPIKESMNELPELPAACQWAVFLRNHDELNLSRLTDDEQQEVYEAFGPEDDMRIFGRGVRRRLAPMLGNDRPKLELMHSLMLSLPGTPVFRYGQEIGMGDDLDQPGRNSIRTPMQWSHEKNGGFSIAPGDDLIRPVISEGPYSYHEVNYEKQSLDPESFYNWLVRAIRVRTVCPEFGEGTAEFLDVGDSRVLAHRCETVQGTVVAVHNLSDEAVTISLKGCVSDAERVIDLFGATYQKAEDLADFELCEYGYRWLRVIKRTPINHLT